MNWPGGVLGRALAAVYLVAFPATYTAVVWILIMQLTGRDEPIPGAVFPVFLGGVLTIVALSWALRRRVPERTNRLTKKMPGDQRAYHRLLLGLELRTAWHAMRGSAVDARD